MYWHYNRFLDHHAAQELSLKAALVGYALAGAIRKNDQFQIQGSRLAEQTGLHENSVKRAAFELEAAGIISRQRRGRRSATLYTWVMVCPIGPRKPTTAPPRLMQAVTGCLRQLTALLAMR